MEDLFLDTNVIIKREFSDNQKKIEEIEDFLKEKNKLISTYVCMELNRTVLADAETLKTYLYDCMNLNEIRERIRALSNSTRMKHRLELNVIPSKTDCEKGQYMADYSCRGIKSSCRVTENVEKNKDLLRTLKIELVQDVQDVNRDRGKLDICWSLDEIIRNPEKTKENPRNCFNVGDILIALDVPDNFTLVSGDKDFFLICEVLKISFYYIDP